MEAPLGHRKITQRTPIAGPEDRPGCPSGRQSGLLRSPERDPAPPDPATRQPAPNPDCIRRRQPNLTRWAPGERQAIGGNRTVSTSARRRRRQRLSRSAGLQYARCWRCSHRRGGHRRGGVRSGRCNAGCAGGMAMETTPAMSRRCNSRYPVSRGEWCAPTGRCYEVVSSPESTSAAHNPQHAKTRRRHTGDPFITGAAKGYRRR